jgi:hypothetical protein
MNKMSFGPEEEARESAATDLWCVIGQITRAN